MDNGLDALLDDALADFDKPAPGLSKPVNEKKPQGQGDVADSPVLQPPVNLFDEFFDEDMSGKLQQEWNAAMKELNDEDPALADHIKMMSQNLNAPSTSGTSQNSKPSQSSDFDAKVKEALKSMAQSNSDNIPGEDVMKNMFNLNLNDPDASGDDFPGLGMMEDMMKMMLSKDMLYPPMNEMRKNFPEWLEKNQNSISESEKKNYGKQLNCLDVICKEFESETVSDSDATKKERFNAIMSAVNEMQQYGQPPASLLDEHDAASIPQEACRIS